MSSSDVTLRCWEIGGTPKAILISMVPKSRNPNPGGIWLPKSMLDRISRFPAKTGEWAEVEITMSEWFAEKKGLI